MNAAPRRAGGASLLIDGEIRGLTPPARPIFAFAFVVALLLPFFAHGCHGDDVDHEPSAPLHEPESRR
jgi:hypothetical protein